MTMKARALEVTKNKEINSIQDVERLMRQAVSNKNTGYSESTIQAQLDTVSLYWRFINGQGLSDSAESVIVLIQSLKEMDLDGSTINARIIHLKRYLLELIKLKGDFKDRTMIIDFFNTEVARLKPQKRADRALKRTEYLSIEQVRSLCHKVEKPGNTSALNLSLLIQALFWTGCRVSEIVTLKAKDIKIQDDFVQCKVTGKGKKSRFVEMPRELFSTIRKRIPGARFLFEQDGKPLTRFSVTKKIKRAGLLLGKNVKISAHTLRHSRAMDLKERGLSADKVAGYLGHVDVNVCLDVYFHGKATTQELGTLDGNTLLGGLS